MNIFSNLFSVGVIIFSLFWTCSAFDTDCGLTTIDTADDKSAPVITRRLAGGQNAVHGEFPWQVRLRSFGQLTYSGVLVRKNWVITAASCFEGNYSPSLWTAILNDLSSTSLDPGEKIIYVDSIFLYGGFKRGDSRNNLALVKLDSRETSGLQMPAACIANGTEDLNSECVIVGWGSTESGKAPSDTLRKLSVRLLSATECSRQQVAPSVSRDQLCVIPADDAATNLGEAVGPCTGDRGSPVLCKTGNRWSVVGVVSDEYACQTDQASAPLVVNIEQFSAWIDKIISQF